MKWFLLLMIVIVIFGYISYKQLKPVGNIKPQDRIEPITLNNSILVVNNKIEENIGIEVLKGEFAPLIKKGANEPTKVSFTFTTTDDNQDQITLKFYKGNNNNVAQNNFLGEYVFSGFKLGKAVEPLIEIILIVEKNNLKLKCIDRKSENLIKIVKNK